MSLEYIQKIYEKITNCINIKCRKELTQLDILQTGRLCYRCYRDLEEIVTKCNNLQRTDIFSIGGSSCLYIVTDVDTDSIYYRKATGNSNKCYKFSRNSSEFVSIKNNWKKTCRNGK